MEISEEKLTSYLYDKSRKIKIFKETSSTNKAAQELGGVVIAECQTDGYGKYGRSFFSPYGGLYMSLVLPFDRTPAEFTMKAAVASCRAIETVCKKNVGIKWVNDIILDNKKVGGILAESNGQDVIIGIGLNVLTGAFPPSLPHAGSILQDTDTDILTPLAAKIINLIYSEDISIYDEYKSRMVLMGEYIQVTQGDDVYKAKPIALEQDGRLVVEKCDGTKISLIAGEIDRIIHA